MEQETTVPFQYPIRTSLLFGVFMSSKGSGERGYVCWMWLIYNRNPNIDECPSEGRKISGWTYGISALWCLCLL